MKYQITEPRIANITIAIFLWTERVLSEGHLLHPVPVYAHPDGQSPHTCK